MNVKEILAWNRRDIWILSDWNRIRTHNYIVCKRALNHLIKLAYFSHFDMVNALPIRSTYIIYIISRYLFWSVGRTPLQLPKYICIENLIFSQRAFAIIHLLRYFNFEPSFKLPWSRARDLFGSQIPVVTGEFELHISCMRSSYLTQWANDKANQLVSFLYHESIGRFWNPVNNHN